MKKKKNSKPQIIKLYNDGFTAKQLAKQFGYSAAYIYSIVREGEPEIEVEEKTDKFKKIKPLAKPPRIDDDFVSLGSISIKLPKTKALSPEQHIDLLNKALGQLVFEQWLRDLPGSM